MVSVDEIVVISGEDEVPEEVDVSPESVDSVVCDVVSDPVMDSVIVSSVVFPSL